MSISCGPTGGDLIDKAGISSTPSVVADKIPPMPTPGNWIRAVVCAALLGLAWTGLRADMRGVSLLELAEHSDVVLIGKVTEVGGDSASVVIEEVLAGKPAGHTATVRPIYLQHCTGSSLNFAVNERVLLFGKDDGSARLTLTIGDQGKMSLTAETEAIQRAAVKRLVEVAPLENPEKNFAMLSLVRSENETLRNEARRYVSSGISPEKIDGRFQNELVTLMGDADPEIQRVGLAGIRFIKTPEAVPRMVELARGENLLVLSDASMALAQYDTVESVAALIALTQHESSEIRKRACLDLGRSRRPEAKAALIKLLDDRDPKVRALGPVGLVGWLRGDQADDALPRLVELLEDPEPAVGASAAVQLGECRNSALVPPLLDALKKTPSEESVKRGILNALYCHYSKGDAQAKELIDANLAPIIAALKASGPHDGSGPSFQAVGILDLSPKSEAKEALEWAVLSHPNRDIQEYAERSLAN